MRKPRPWHGNGFAQVCTAYKCCRRICFQLAPLLPWTWWTKLVLRRTALALKGGVSSMARAPPAATLWMTTELGSFSPRPHSIRCLSRVSFLTFGLNKTLDTLWFCSTRKARHIFQEEQKPKTHVLEKGYLFDLCLTFEIVALRQASLSSLLLRLVGLLWHFFPMVALPPPSASVTSVIYPISQSF